MPSLKRARSFPVYSDEPYRPAKRHKAAHRLTEKLSEEEASFGGASMEVAMGGAEVDLTEEETIDETTFDEAGRQAMVTIILSDLDKLYNDFDVLVRAYSAVEEYAVFTKKVIRDSCLQLGGADCLDHTPKPPTMEQIVDFFVESPHAPYPRNRKEGLDHLNDHVLYDFVAAIDEGQSVLWKSKLSVKHAITSWAVWNRDAITRALQDASPAELLHISQHIDVTTADKLSILQRLITSSDPVIVLHKLVQSKALKSSQHKRAPSSDDVLLRTFGQAYNDKHQRKVKDLAAIQSLYNFRLGGHYTRSGLSTQLLRVDKFMGQKDFTVWRYVESTSAVKYMGHKPVFESFYYDLMSFPVIARQLAENGKGEQEDRGAKCVDIEALTTRYQLKRI